MAVGDLGKLEHGNVREAWDKEQQDFTPWLANNLDMLADVLDLGELEAEDTEVHTSGRYRADIVARAIHDNRRIVIENQLEEANLRHLGQLLAYVSGLEAQVVIWIATGFDDAHLAAIRWLNQYTVRKFEFFAIRVSVVRIGDSKLAPVFEVLEQPNAWEKELQSDFDSRGSIAAGSAASAVANRDLRKLRREFWIHYDGRFPDVIGETGKAWRSKYWETVDDMEVHVGLARNDVAVYIRTPGAETEDAQEHIEAYFEQIKEQVEDEVRFSHYKQWCRTSLSTDVSDTNNWDAMIDWLEERRKMYLDILGEVTDDDSD